MPYKPGESGNLKGRPKGIVETKPRGTLRTIVKAFIEEHPEDIDAALLRCVKGRSPEKILAVMQKVEGDTVEMPALSDLAAALSRKVNLTVIPGPSKGPNAHG